MGSTRQFALAKPTANSVRADPEGETEQDLDFEWLPDAERDFRSDPEDKLRDLRIHKAREHQRNNAEAHEPGDVEL